MIEVIAIMALSFVAAGLFIASAYFIGGIGLGLLAGSLCTASAAFLIGKGLRT